MSTELEIKDRKHCKVLLGVKKGGLYSRQWFHFGVPFPTNSFGSRRLVRFVSVFRCLWWVTFDSALVSFSVFIWNSLSLCAPDIPDLGFLSWQKINLFSFNPSDISANIAASRFSDFQHLSQLGMLLACYIFLLFLWQLRNVNWFLGLGPDIERY